MDFFSVPITSSLSFGNKNHEVDWRTRVNLIVIATFKKFPNDNFSISAALSNKNSIGSKISFYNLSSLNKTWTKLMVELSKILIVFYNETETTIGVLISWKSQETQSYIKAVHIIYCYWVQILLRPSTLLAWPIGSWSTLPAAW